MPLVDELISHWSPDPAVDLVTDYAIFRGISPESAKEKLERRPANLDPLGASDSFYGSSEDFLLNLIRAQIGLRHLTGRVGLVLDVLKSHKGLEILDAGGGLGNYCIALSRSGHVCTYADIPGCITEFARQRFSSRSCPIDVCDVRELPSKRFHAVLSFDVLEHLEDPVSAMVEYSMHCLQNGLLFLAADFMNFAEPFHLRKNFGYSFIYEAVLAALGFELANGGGLTAVESIMKAGVRIYRKTAPCTSRESLEKSAKAAAREKYAEYASYFQVELGRLDRALS